jgi:hypothetical protein
VVFDPFSIINLRPIIRLIDSSSTEQEMVKLTEALQVIAQKFSRIYVHGVNLDKQRCTRMRYTVMSYLVLDHPAINI